MDQGLGVSPTSSVVVCVRLWASVTVLKFDDGDGDYERYMVRVPTSMVEAMFFEAGAGSNPLGLTEGQLRKWNDKTPFMLESWQAECLTDAIKDEWVTGEKSQDVATGVGHNRRWGSA